MARASRAPSAAPAGPSQFAASARGQSNLGSGSRVSYASHYSNTNETPMNREVGGLPISTITATGLAAIFYVVSIIVILATDCPFSREVIYFFTFLLVALLALASMAGINMVFSKYRFNCLSLSISLLYSGSAALILLGLIESAVHGLCHPGMGGGASGVKPTSKPMATTTLSSNATNESSIPTTAPQLDVYPLNDQPDTRTIDYFVRVLAGKQQETGSLFHSSFVPNYVIWFMTAIGLCFQLVAHYYYG